MNTCANCGEKSDDAADICSQCGSPKLIPDQLREVTAWIEALFLVTDSWKLTNLDSVVQSNYVRFGSLIPFKEIDCLGDIIRLVNGSGAAISRPLAHCDVLSVANRSNNLVASYILLDPFRLTEPGVALGEVKLSLSNDSRLCTCRLPRPFRFVGR